MSTVRTGLLDLKNSYGNYDHPIGRYLKYG